MRRHLIVGLGLLSLAWSIFPNAAAQGATTVVEPDPRVVETGFRLKGSHGYSISVLAYSVEGDNRGTIEFFVRRRGAYVSYRAPASVTAAGIRANLDGIATIDVTRRPSGETKKVRPRCSDLTLAYEPATYEGMIDFHGEDGYTQAHANRVAHLPFWLVFGGGGTCSGSGYGEVSGPGEPGARLRGVSFAHGRKLSFQVNKNGPKARAVFMASLVERREGIRIKREIAGAAEPDSFRFAPSLQTATLAPPSPFNGSASLSRSRNSVSPIWSGNLTLDFPGRSEVPLAGPGVHVSLVHARFTRSNDSSVEIGSSVLFRDE